VNIYTESGGTKDDCEAAMEQLRKAGTPFLLKDEGTATVDDLRSNRVVFLKTDLGHGEVVVKREAFRRFLETSSLRRDITR
jgi:hypothetical protein